ncbi:MAG: peptidyl-prolyl cis-trans isomerase [Cryomorphaceae bacterium]|nr:MAG: peptidyl-prolyl cis-trans isomerase [Cryomorphaceae bacterium]
MPYLKSPYDLTLLRVPAQHLMLVLLLPVLLFACDWQDQSKSDWVVRVDDHYLSREELVNALPRRLSPEDSTRAADAYVSQWLKDHVVLSQAELNLSPQRINFEAQLRDYRNSLVVYTFETELIRQKLDTTVTDAEIARYYQEYQRNFELKDYIVRVRYIKVASDAPKLADVEAWMKSEADDDYFKLVDYSQQFASKSFLEEERWLYLDDLLRQVPIRPEDKLDFLRGNKFVKLPDGDYLYMLNILDYQLKDGVSPLEFVKQDIRNIIVNKRKREFIINMRQDLFETALKNNQIEYRTQ